MVAESLLNLRRKRAIVVNGAGFMDEASLAGTNEMMMVDNGDLIPFTLHPEEVGLPTYSNDEIRGGNARENADILLSEIGRASCRERVEISVVAVMWNRKRAGRWEEHRVERRRG